MTQCQACNGSNLKFILSLGWLPPPNDFRPLDTPGTQQTWMPTDLFYCQDCSLVQLAYTGPAQVVFPAHYPYRSGVTKILRDNFANLYGEMKFFLDLQPNDMIIDIGSNDGTLLSNFVGKHHVLGIEPTDIADLANARSIPTFKAFFNSSVGKQIKANNKNTRIIVTCANCFAHMPDVADIVDGIKSLIGNDGVFVSESHYLLTLLKDLQYDTIYHEHLRYYSVTSIRNLLRLHGLEVVHVVPIPTHGGSIRVYAAKPGLYPIQPSVEAMIAVEPDDWVLEDALYHFAEDVWLSKMQLLTRLFKERLARRRVVGISAPSRAATVVNYCKLELDYIAEVSNSLKVGKYMPGTSIPVIDEKILFGNEQPEVAILFSWHIADELIPKLKQQGYKGKFILPCERMNYAEVA